MSGGRPLALVTGASRRVGRAIAIELARAGFDLIITWRRRPEEAGETLRLARDASSDDLHTGEAHLCDLTDAASVDELASRVLERPALDALIHNASLFERTDYGTVTERAAIEHFRVNALSPLLLTQRLSPLLERSALPGGGAVVLLGDIHPMGRPYRGRLVYFMSKAAVAVLTETLAIELAPRVRVNAVAPGVVAWPEGTAPDDIHAYERRIPLARSGTPEDAAGAVRWLVTDAPYVTGEVIRVDGGRWLR
jgi:pteridine reductase